MVLSNRDAIGAARHHQRLNPQSRPVIKNFGSDFFPGGGYSKGKSNAMDESMCYQCPTLFPVLIEHFQARKQLAGRGQQWLVGTECVYIPEVPVCRDFEKKELSHFEPVHVIYMPAIRQPALSKDGTEFVRPEDQTLLDAKVRTWYRVAKAHGHRVLIDGKWGMFCFKNPGIRIIEAALRVLDEAEFAGAFDVLEFAMLSEHDQDWNLFATAITEWERREQEPVVGASDSDNDDEKSNNEASDEQDAPSSSSTTDGTTVPTMFTKSQKRRQRAKQTREAHRTIQ